MQDAYGKGSLREGAPAERVEEHAQRLVFAQTPKLRRLLPSSKLATSLPEGGFSVSNPSNFLKFA